MFGPVSENTHSASQAVMNGAGQATQTIPGSGQSAVASHMMRQTFGTSLADGQIDCSWIADFGQRPGAVPGPYS
jgi:hypothetical protein